MSSTSYVGKLHNTKYLCQLVTVHTSLANLYDEWHGYWYSANIISDVIPACTRYRQQYGLWIIAITHLQSSGCLSSISTAFKLKDRLIHKKVDNSIDWVFFLILMFE